MIDIHIYAIHEREAMVQALSTKLGLDESCIHYDDRESGSDTLYTAEKAWLADMPEGLTHRVVLPDDADVCNGFKEICEKMVAAHPDDIFCLYPMNLPAKRSGVFRRIITPYVIAKGVSGVGVIMPVKYIKECFAWIDETVPSPKKEDDYSMWCWARQKGVRVLTTIPSIVQYLGDVSVANPDVPIRRTTYFKENPTADWSNTKVVRYVEHEWFFSNKGVPDYSGGVIDYVD